MKMNYLTLKVIQITCDLSGFLSFKVQRPTVLKARNEIFHGGRESGGQKSEGRRGRGPKHKI